MHSHMGGKLLQRFIEQMQQEAEHTHNSIADQDGNLRHCYAMVSSREKSLL